MTTNKSYCVYQIKRPDSTNDQRKYIGVSHFSKTYNPLKRFQRNHMYSSYAVGNFIRKYPDVYLEIILTNLSKEEAYKLEALLVPKTDKERKALFLLNECPGGSCPPTFNELNFQTKSNLRKKRSANVTGIKNPCYGKLGKNHPAAKSFSLLSPTGEIYSGVCIRTFAQQFNLSESCLTRVISGERKYHKGWSKIIQPLKAGPLQEDCNIHLPD